MLKFLEKSDYMAISIKTKDIISFYIVGLILFSIPFTRNLFSIITPLSLAGVLAIILYEHKTWNFKTVFWFSFIIAASFLVEFAGVYTGEIFGSYRYATGLGIKLLDVPLIIGVNWLFLLYATYSMVNRKIKSSFLRIPAAAALMVAYDIVIEFAAPVMDLWHFDTSYPPFQNFLAWFVLSIIFISGFEILKIKTNGKTAKSFYIVQIVFLGIIAIFGNIFLK